MQHVYLSGYMAEVIDFLFSMYSCNVHDSFVEVIGQQLGMLLKTKRKKKKDWNNHAMERSYNVRV